MLLFTRIQVRCGKAVFRAGDHLDDCARTKAHDFVRQLAQRTVLQIEDLQTAAQTQFDRQVVELWILIQM